jgi:hypothetical protein
VWTQAPVPTGVTVVHRQLGPLKAAGVVAQMHAEIGADLLKG